MRNICLLGRSAHLPQEDGSLLDGSCPSEMPASSSSPLPPAGPSGHEHALRTTAPPSPSPLSFACVPLRKRDTRRERQEEGERRDSVLYRPGRAASSRVVPLGLLCVWAQCGRGHGGFLECGGEDRVSEKVLARLWGGLCRGWAGQRWAERPVSCWARPWSLSSLWLFMTQWCE